MAGGKKDDFENEILDHMLGVASSSFDASVWIALFTVTPSDAAAGTEVTGNGYARLEVGGATGRDFTAAAS